MAISTRAELTGVTTEQHDELHAKLQVLPGNAFEGCLAHVTVPTGSGLRIFDLWESEQAPRRFDETVMPVAAEAGGPRGGMPQTSQVHDHGVPGMQPAGALRPPLRKILRRIPGELSIPVPPVRRKGERRGKPPSSRTEESPCRAS
ncbi:hypothetical protein ACWDZ4_11670 [Streptomyces sp. NPDC003016]